MAKDIFKQGIITIAIIMAILLVLAIIFYQYIPTNKVIPTKVTEYKTPESVIPEISENTTEQEFSSENQVMEITDSDLSIYKSQRSYNPGKSDPFAAGPETSSSTTSTVTTQNSGSSNTGSTATNNNNNSSNENQNSTNNYYKAAGIEPGTK